MYDNKKNIRLISNSVILVHTLIYSQKTFVLPMKILHTCEIVYLTQIICHCQQFQNHNYKKWFLLCLNVRYSGIHDIYTFTFA